MSYSEFPHSNYSDWDLRQLIELYKKLIDEYSTVEQVAEETRQLNSTLTENFSTFKNEVEQKINVFTAEIDDRVANGITQGLGDIRNEFNSFKETINSQLNEFTKTVNNNINLLDNRVDTIDDRVSQQNQYIAQLRQSYETALELKAQELEQKVTESSADNLAEMNDLLKQEVQKLQQQINEIKASDNSSIEWIRRNWLYVCGMNAREFSDYGCITCDEWNESGITCDEWYMNSKRFFGFDSRMMLMYSPFTGLPTNVITVMYELVNALKVNALTAGEYECMHIEAGEEPASNMYRYDWKGECLNV